MTEDFDAVKDLSASYEIPLCTVYRKAMTWKIWVFRGISVQHSICIYVP